MPPWGFASINGADLDAKVFPPLTYLVEGLLTTGSVALLGGAPKAGKSVLATGCSLAVAQGGRALGGLECVRTDVLMVALDDGSERRLQRRLRMLNAGEPIPRSLDVVNVPFGAGVTAAERISSYLDHHRDTGLVVIDTLERLRPSASRGASPYSADVAFLATLQPILRQHPDVCILGLAHSRKAGRGSGDEPAPEDDPISAISGTHGVTGGADAVLVLSGGRKNPLRTLDVVSRDEEDSRKVLQWSAIGWVVSDHDPDDPRLGLSADDAKVYDAVRDFGALVTAADLAEVLPGMPKIGNRLASLDRRGYLVKEARGAYRLP